MQSLFIQWRIDFNHGHCFTATLAIPRLRDFFALDIPPLDLDLVIAAIVVVAIGILELGWRAWILAAEKSRGWRATHGAGTLDP